MTINPELKYSRDHEWVKEEDGLCVIGISDFAQDALGDLVFVNLPEVGDAVTAGEAFGDVESVKVCSRKNYAQRVLSFRLYFSPFRFYFDKISLNWILTGVSNLNIILFPAFNL